MSNADAKYIAQAADELGYTLHPKYSGRGMMGRNCIAIELSRFTDIGRVMFHLGAINQDPDVNDLTELVFDYRYDQFGKGYILYWPLIECPVDLTTEDGNAR